MLVMNNIAYIMCRGDIFSFRILVHKPVQKRPLRRPRKCGDNIKLDVMGTACGGERYDLVCIHDHVISGLCMKGAEH